MELNVVELIVQAGSLGLVVLILFGLWKFGGAMVTRIMDNLDAQTRNTEASIHVQEKMAAGMTALCERLDGSEERDEERDRGTEKFRAETLNALKELSGAIRGLQQQQQAHEGRAQKRHELQVAQGEQLLEAFKALNGKG